jgi:protein-disulfide isomerase
MSQDMKIIVGISVATLLILFGGVFFLAQGQEETVKSVNDPNTLVRLFSHKITADNAKITIVEFADFQCPACANTHPVLKQILEEYKGKINFVYRHFPLPQHKNAILAAKAAEIAGEQGKFWEMYDVLYEKQIEWSESSTASELFTQYAKELALDTNSFSTLLNSTKYEEVIQQDKSDGTALGVNSTPTLFINSKKLDVFPTYQSLRGIIEEELKK